MEGLVDAEENASSTEEVVVSLENKLHVQHEQCERLQAQLAEKADSPESPGTVERVNRELIKVKVSCTANPVRAHVHRLMCTALELVFDSACHRIKTTS